MAVASLESASIAADALLSPEQHFSRRVLPLLESRCISCHGPDKVKGKLRMDSRSALLKGGESGPAIVPGKPSESLILKAVMHEKKDLEMPPKEKLSPQDISFLDRWIRDGAPWPVVEAIANTPSTNSIYSRKIGDAWTDPENPIAILFGGQRLDLWSLKPIRNPVPPTVRQSNRVANPIDAFILAGLERQGLEPSPQADRRTLIRRLYYDLTGLPPAPEEVEPFVQDSRPDAYERLVDRLLASPRHGEHWARMWLDVTRYSDSNGFDWDEYRPQAWRYRDYVIRSFNADKPFDRFVLEQLAGDELLAGPPRNQDEQDAWIATGYLRMGPQDNSSAAFNEQDRSRAELMADLVETTGSAFLGMTFSCCRCHDHKYDPLSQADHFRFRAFFEGVRPADDVPLDLAEEQEAIQSHNAKLDLRIQTLRTERESLLKPTREKLITERRNQLDEKDRALLAIPVSAQTNDIKVKVEKLLKQTEPSEKDVLATLSNAEKDRATQLASEIQRVQKEKRTFTHGLLMTDTPDKLALTRVLFQGDYRQPRQTVVPGFLSALDPNPATIEKPITGNTLGRRTSLANWIVSASNPLTARVLVNRLWQGYFGKGLVSTPNDFGLAGARPSHPELLDWLAQEFMRSGWSLKAMHRTLVLSSTYRQASSGEGPAQLKARKTDSENVLHWRQNPRRLTAEQLRDSVLQASGSLRHVTGGKPYWPDLPPEVLQANPAFLDDNAEKTKGWYPSPLLEQNARSIFMVQKRTVRVPWMETFDLPENGVSCARRNVSTVAPQALSMLNSPFAVQAAALFAERVRYDIGSDFRGQIRHAWRLALQRNPSQDEFLAAEPLCRTSGLNELCRVLLNLNEFIYRD